MAWTDFKYDPEDGLENSTTFESKPVNGGRARQQFMIILDQIKVFLNGTVKSIRTDLDSHKAETVSQFVYAERNGQTAGIQTISGLTDIPKHIEIRAYIPATPSLSIGNWEQSGGQSGAYQYQAGYFAGSSERAVGIYADAVNGLAGTVQNVQNGSFEISWAMTGTGVPGIIAMEIVCLYH